MKISDEAVGRAILRAEWRAQVDDTIGGWCITDAAIPGTPADGNQPIAHFIHEKVALHIAGIHNDWIREQATATGNDK